MDTEYVIKLTYAELYNEELRDLLSPTPNENLKIVDDPQLGPLIQNITEANFTTASDVKHLLEEGEKSRHFGVTNMNAHSSRSHVLVRLSIESRKVATRPSNPLRLSWGRDKPQCVSTLNLVDLAGSERAAKSGTSGQSLKEGSFINKSLLTLGTVISNLSEGKTGQHIPYRNSKLTRLLATALGGNARTAMITCISPASGNVMESLSTLRFASRAKRIVNMVQKNVILDAKTLASKLALQNAEIDQLRQQLEQSRLLGFVPDDPEQGESLKDRAISASRNWRSLRFLISNSSKVISSLRGAGLTVIAKKVQHDLRDAVAGTKDLADIIAEHTAIINTHLPHETKLVHRLHQLHRENDGDSIVGEHHDEVSELDDASVDGDMFEMGNYDSEELREKMEQSQLNGEDFRVVAIRRIHQLEHEAGEISRKEKKARSTMDELNIMLIEREEQIKLLRSSENSHLKTIDDLKVSLDNEQNKFAQTSQESVMRINELVIQLSDKDAELVEKDQMLMKKDAEIDKLRIATEKLTKDLTHSLQSKRAIEEETMRARNEMRTQMDRLRANMHDLLVQGGEENKVVESHNAELQREIDSLQDTLLEVNQSKERLEMEVQRLMHDRESFREEEKARIEQIQAARNEVSKHSIYNSQSKQNRYIR